MDSRSKKRKETMHGMIITITNFLSGVGPKHLLRQQIDAVACFSGSDGRSPGRAMLWSSSIHGNLIFFVPLSAAKNGSKFRTESLDPNIIIIRRILPLFLSHIVIFLTLMSIFSIIIIKVVSSTSA